jgi:hypothetical protein
MKHGMATSQCIGRVLFRKMTKETSGYVRRQFEQGNDISWRDAVKGNTITQGLRYSLATGNWGLQGDLAIKPGVAQVPPHFHASTCGCAPSSSTVHCRILCALVLLACRVPDMSTDPCLSSWNHLEPSNPCPTSRR